MAPRLEWSLPGLTRFDFVTHHQESAQRAVMKKAIQFALALAVFLFASSSHAVVYALDDGSADFGLGIAPAMTFGNRFAVVSGGEVITTISIAWYSGNGVPVTVELWSDPNGDGNPNDAILLASVRGVISNASTDTFITYDIPDVRLLLPSFFVGATILSDSAHDLAAAGDIAPPNAHQSWLASAADFSGSSPSKNGLTGLSVQMRRVHPFRSPYRWLCSVSA
jgi:hypothetical protein